MAILMKTIIVYESKHGATAKCAQDLSKVLEGDTVLCNLKEDEIPNLSEYDAIVIGGPVYAGQIPKKLKHWIGANQTEFDNKKLGVFICGMTKGEKTVELIRNAVPSEIIKKASAVEFLGGAFYMNRMNFFEKWILKMVSKSDDELVFEHGPEGDYIENFDEVALNRFAGQMNHE